MSLKEYPDDYEKKALQDVYKRVQAGSSTLDGGVWTAPAEIAMQLGIRRNQLYKWKEQLARSGEAAFSGKRGRPAKEDQSELATLK